MMSQTDDPVATGAAPATPPPAAPLSYSGSAAAGPIEENKDARTMGMLAHLLAIFTGFLGPLIIWLIKKNDSPFVDDQGKEALNFQITMLFGFIACFILAFVIIGAFLMPVLWILNIVFCIIATMKANQGIRYRYPFAIRLIK